MSSPQKVHMIRLVPQPNLDLRGFLLDRQARGLSTHTIAFYRNELRQFWNFLGPVEAGEITAEDIRRYLLYLGKRRNPGGVHVAYRALRAFFNWWQEETDSDTNPIAKVKAPKVPQEPLEPLSLKDLKAMLRTCERRTFKGDRDRAILLCLLDTGTRASEFLSLNVGDVNLGTGAVLVKRGKGDKSRMVFLGAKARRELLRYLRHRPEVKDADPLWVTRNGKRLTYGGLRGIMRRRAKKAGVPTPSLHGFRRAFALLCLRSGVNIYSLQRLMGHSDLSVLRRYLKQTEDDLRLAHEAGGPVDNWL